MALVLCAEIDRILLETRKIMLEQAGHIVITAADQPALGRACDDYEFDVVVVGQCTSSMVKRSLVSFVRQHCPAARVLELHRVYEQPQVEDADSWLEVPVAAPGQLARRVAELAAWTRQIPIGA